jgi:hypothetical protein
MERARIELKKSDGTPGEWKELRALLVEALKEMPEARERLIQVFEEGIQKKKKKGEK